MWVVSTASKVLWRERPDLSEVRSLWLTRNESKYWASRTWTMIHRNPTPLKRSEWANFDVPVEMKSLYTCILPAIHVHTILHDDHLSSFIIIALFLSDTALSQHEKSPTPQAAVTAAQVLETMKYKVSDKLVKTKYSISEIRDGIVARDSEERRTISIVLLMEMNIPKKEMLRKRSWADAHVVDWLFRAGQHHKRVPWSEKCTRIKNWPLSELPI